MESAASALVEAENKENGRVIPVGRWWVGYTLIFPTFMAGIAYAELDWPLFAAAAAPGTAAFIYTTLFEKYRKRSIR